MEYRYGILHCSSGNSSVVIAPSHQDSVDSLNEQEEASSDFSDSTYDESKSLISEVKAQSSYMLTLQSCSVISKTPANRRKRSSSDEQSRTHSSLRAHVNES